MVQYKCNIYEVKDCISTQKYGLFIERRNKMKNVFVRRKRIRKEGFIWKHEGYLLGSGVSIYEEDMTKNSLSAYVIDIGKKKENSIFISA